MSHSRAGTYCCVVNCTNNTRNRKGVKLYSFSVKAHRKEQTEKWISAIRRVNADGSSWRPSKYSRICSDHFIGNEKCDSPFSPSFVPTLFPKVYLKPKPSQKFIDSATKRYEKRLLKRGNTSMKTTESKHRKMASEIEEDYTEHVPESVITDDTNDRQQNSKSIEQGTQVDFLPKENYVHCNIFICNRFICSDKCEAETQASFQTQAAARSTVRNIKSKDAICGSDVTYTDKCVGPEPTHMHRNSISKCNNGFHGYESITSEEHMNNIAGVRLQAFKLLLSFIVNVSTDKLSRENRLLLFLMKMKLGLTSSALGVLFNIHRTTAARYFHSVLETLVTKCKHLVTWPSKETVQELLPDAFKEKYENCRVIIDCTEFPVEQPPEINQRVHFYSHYKKGFTIKVLVGCTPNGYISLISKSYGGRTTDSQITNESGLLQLLEPGDMVLADKGFPAIKTKLDELGNGTILVMPPFLRNEYFTTEEVNETQEIASLRIHIERIMQRIKTYRILHKININMLPYIDAIIHMSAILVNVQPPIIKCRIPDVRSE